MHDIEIRLIDADGEQLGIMLLSHAKKIAENKDLDLIEIAPNAKPPVCKIMNYSKYKYEQLKKAKEAKKKQKFVMAKEIRTSLNIDDHDLQVKIKKAREFLESGNKVKLLIKFRGREINRMSSANDLIKKFVESLQGISVIERHAVFENRSVFMILMPIDNKKVVTSNVEVKN
jgi:translation initiation factor IF-3